MNKDLKLLKQDEHYYGEAGKKYLSASGIKTLLTNPAAFGKDQEDTKAMMQGRLFHQMVLQPELDLTVPIVNASSRNTKMYKETLEDSGLPFMFLSHEIDEVRGWVNVILSNFRFYEAIRAEGNLFEQPAIGEIGGEMFKGKADIVTDSEIIDLKTTGDINSFHWNARKYGYDTQAYIYNCLFSKPMRFYVLCKETLQLGIFKTSPQFIEQGKHNTEAGIEVYRKYFKKGHTEDIIDHVIEETL